MKFNHLVKKSAFAASLAMFSLTAFADDSSLSNLGSFETNIGTVGQQVLTIVMMIATLAGVILIIKGLVHLKQNYTSAGGGQEKHLSKGIASLVFGVLLILAIPISHMLVGSVEGASGSNAAAFNTNVGNISFS